MSARPHSPSTHRHAARSNARTLGMHATAVVLMAVLSACRGEITEPADARGITTGERAAFSVTHAAVWDGHIISIESRQVNSAGQTVCLDLPAGGPFTVFSLNAFSGQDVVYSPCHYGPSQQFVLTAEDAGFGRSWVVLQPVSNTSVCLDIRGHTNTSGARLQLATCDPRNASSYQTFLFPVVNFPSATGVPVVSTICVRAGLPSMVLDVPLPAAVSGPVQQYLINRGQNQLWRFRDTRSGQYYVAPLDRVQTCSATALG